MWQYIVPVCSADAADVIICIMSAFAVYYVNETMAVEDRVKGQSLLIGSQVPWEGIWQSVRWCACGFCRNKGNACNRSGTVYDRHGNRVHFCIAKRQLGGNDEFYQCV